MPFLSFLPAIKYFGHFQNPDTFVVDIYLLSAVDFAMGIGRCVNDDLLNELMQDTRCQLRDIGVLADNGQKPVNIGTFAFYFFDFLTEYCSLCLQTSLFRFIIGGQLVKTLVCQLAADVVLIQPLEDCMSRAGTPTDNATMEAINGWINADLFMDFHVTGERPVKEEIDDYIAFFNEQRPAYSLNYLTPVQFRMSYAPITGVQ